MNFNDPDFCKDKTIGGRYLLKEKLGSGTFGHIYLAFDNIKKMDIALKLESKSKDKTTFLMKEYTVLAELVNHIGFSTSHFFGTDQGINYIAMDLLGNNLERLFKVCEGRFSLKTVLMLASQMIDRIETLHKKNYLHRDIKPENFCVGLNEKSRNLYLIDFGLARSYIEKGEHIPYKEGKGFIGNARYASMSTHLGIENSRKDDLESIGYTFIYFLKGKLPWQSVRTENKDEKYRLIKEQKLRTSAKELCKGLPKEFIEYFGYVNSLRFTDQPNYSYLKGLFQSLFKEKGYEFDYQYDWLIKKKVIVSNNTQKDKENVNKRLKERRPQEEKGEWDTTIIPEEKKNIDMNKLEAQKKNATPFTKELKLFKMKVLGETRVNLQGSMLGSMQQSTKINTFQTLKSINISEAQRNINNGIMSSHRRNSMKEENTVLRPSDIFMSPIQNEYPINKVCEEFLVKNLTQSKSIKEKVMTGHKRNLSCIDNFVSNQRTRNGKEDLMTIQEILPKAKRSHLENYKEDSNYEGNLNEDSIVEWSEGNTLLEWVNQTKKNRKF